MRLELVTGYIPIQNHPRTAKKYGELGEELFGKLRGDFVIHPFYEKVPETWLCKLIQKLGIDVTHSAGDNPAKNTLAYHCVNHQKFAWLLKAALNNPIPETFVWMDYGIGHVPGVTADVVNNFMANVRTNDLAIPGCWDIPYMTNDYFPCWRFCGGLMVVPRQNIHKLYKALKAQVERHIKRTSNVTWEVNSLAATEFLGPPIRWYYADHNQTMFSNYAKDLPCLGSVSSVPTSP